MKFSDEELDAALVRELVSGRKLMETRQQFREKAAAMEAKSMKGHKAIPGLGKAALVMPQHEWFLLREKYGQEAMEDRGFWKDCQRLEPQLVANKL